MNRKFRFCIQNNANHYVILIIGWDKFECSLSEIFFHSCENRFRVFLSKLPSLSET